MISELDILAVCSGHVNANFCVYTHKNLDERKITESDAYNVRKKERNSVSTRLKQNMTHTIMGHTPVRERKARTVMKNTLFRWTIWGKSAFEMRQSLLYYFLLVRIFYASPQKLARPLGMPIIYLPWQWSRRSLMTYFFTKNWTKRRVNSRRLRWYDIWLAFINSMEVIKRPYYKFPFLHDNGKAPLGFHRDSIEPRMLLVQLQSVPAPWAHSALSQQQFARHATQHLPRQIVQGRTACCHHRREWAPSWTKEGCSCSILQTGSARLWWSWWSTLSAGKANPGQFVRRLPLTTAPFSSRILHSVTSVYYLSDDSQTLCRVLANKEFKLDGFLSPGHARMTGW